MQHSLSKIHIFSDDVFDDAVRYKNKVVELKENKRVIPIVSIDETEKLNEGLERKK